MVSGPKEVVVLVTQPTLLRILLDKIRGIRLSTSLINLKLHDVPES